jgi:chemotaxis protein histidine kinase CheA
MKDILYRNLGTVSEEYLRLKLVLKILITLLCLLAKIIVSSYALPLNLIEKIHLVNPPIEALTNLRVINLQRLTLQLIHLTRYSINEKLPNSALSNNYQIINSKTKLQNLY